MIFLFEIPFKARFKIVVFPLWRRDPSGFGAAKSLQFVEPLCVILVRSSTGKYFVQAL